MIIVIKVAGNS